jgi:hypothetical protein
MFGKVREREYSIGNATGIGVLLLLSGLVLNYFLARQNVGPRVELSLTMGPFFITLAGAVLSIVGLTDVPIRRALRIALLMALTITLLYIPFYMGIQFLQTGADRFGECTTLCETAAASRVVPVSVSMPGKPAVFCSVERRGMFLAYYNRIMIYGVTERAAQDAVLKGLSEYYHTAHTNPLEVMFLEKENWTARQGRNGVVSGSRGPEKLIRVVNIG